MMNYKTHRCNHIPDNWAPKNKCYSLLDIID